MYQLYIQLFSRVLLIIGGLVYSFRLFTGKDIICKTKSIWTTILLVLITLSTIMNLFNRDYYLPFLGQTVMPPSPLSSLTPQESAEARSIVVTGLPPNTRVIFWGSQESKQSFENPIVAYGEYENTYVTKSDKHGIALAKLKCPGEYAVKKYGIFNKNIPRHVHYRYESPTYKGLFSRVFTKQLDENCE